VNRAEEFFEQLRQAPPGLSTLRAFQAAQGKTARLEGTQDGSVVRAELSRNPIHPTSWKGNSANFA